jgi:hypothetical protein
MAVTRSVRASSWQGCYNEPRVLIKGIGLVFPVRPSRRTLQLPSVTLSRLILALVIATAVACGGGGTPTGPGPVPDPDPGPVVNNTPPVIGRFTVQGTRINEPPSFADASEDLPISVDVTDAESTIGDLKFNWTAAVGTFSGTGRSVLWKAPASVPAPAEVTINLEVVEAFTSAGKPVENKVTGSTVVSLHDSIKEVGDMARQFLLDFSDSRLKLEDVPYIMRNFEPGCYGTADETAQVADNRRNFEILEWRVEPPVTTVNFGGLCPFRNARGDACARVDVYWKSKLLRDLPDGSRAGAVGAVAGFDQLAAMYYRDQKRWRLCDSAFNGAPVSLRALIAHGLVP